MNHNKMLCRVALLFAVLAVIPSSSPANSTDGSDPGQDLLSPQDHLPTGGNDLTIYLPGDVTGDGFVGSDDLVQILTSWGASGGVTWRDGDISPYGDGVNTGDGFIGVDDYVDVLTYWGTSGNPPVPNHAPEPVTVFGVCIGLAGLAGYARRRFKIGRNRRHGA